MPIIVGCCCENAGNRGHHILKVVHHAKAILRYKLRRDSRTPFHQKRNCQTVMFLRRRWKIALMFFCSLGFELKPKERNPQRFLQLLHLMHSYSLQRYIMHHQEDLKYNYLLQNYLIIRKQLPFFFSFNILSCINGSSIPVRMYLKSVGGNTNMYLCLPMPRLTASAAATAAATATAACILVANRYALILSRTHTVSRLNRGFKNAAIL